MKGKLGSSLTFPSENNSIQSVLTALKIIRQDVVAHTQHLAEAGRSEFMASQSYIVSSEKQNRTPACLRVIGSCIRF